LKLNISEKISNKKRFMRFFDAKEECTVWDEENAKWWF